MGLSSPDGGKFRLKNARKKKIIRFSAKKIVYSLVYLIIFPIFAASRIKVNL